MSPTSYQAAPPREAYSNRYVRMMRPLNSISPLNDVDNGARHATRAEIQIMKAVLQRASHASVMVDGTVVSEFGDPNGHACGLLILLGVKEGDLESDSIYLATKSSELRIFEDSDGKMNLSLAEAGGNVIVVSQFTLLGDWKKGRRPGFSNAARPDEGQRLYMHFVDQLKAKGLKVQTGVFGADMKVRILNDGPVTFLLEARDGKPV